MGLLSTLEEKGCGQALLPFNYQGLLCLISSPSQWFIAHSLGLWCFLAATAQGLVKLDLDTSWLSCDFKMHATCSMAEHDIQGS
jgi:hypothetical protein